jgi:hypothetical protein
LIEHVETDGRGNPGGLSKEFFFLKLVLKIKAQKKENPAASNEEARFSLVSTPLYFKVG